MITTDGAGGAIVVWDVSLPDPDDDDLYAQRGSGSGLIPTAVSELPPTPSLIVGNNYPNPFATQTRFSVTTPRATEESIEVFDVAGRRVRHADLGRVREPWRQVSFDGRDDAGHLLPSGVYFYRVHAGNETATKKMVIAR